jgi:hypothetical protein
VSTSSYWFFSDEMLGAIIVEMWKQPPTSKTVKLHVWGLLNNYLSRKFKLADRKDEFNNLINILKHSSFMRGLIHPFNK